MESPGPASAASGAAAPKMRGARRVIAASAAGAISVPFAARIHEPTLIGEVILKTRSMFRNRSGRPRSEISSAGLTATPASATPQARFASRSFPIVPAAQASGAEAPAMPPTKK